MSGRRRRHIGLAGGAKRTGIFPAREEKRYLPATKDLSFAGIAARRFQLVQLRSVFRHRPTASVARGFAMPVSTDLCYATASFHQPLPLSVGEEFQNGGRGFLDRSTGDIELRPIEFGAQSPRKR